MTKEREGETECFPCSDNAVSEPGSRYCEACSFGYQAVNNTLCMPCPPGTAERYPFPYYIK